MVVCIFFIAVMISTIHLITIANGASSLYLAWDNSQHSSFSLIIEFDLADTLFVETIAVGAELYHLQEPITINSTSGSVVLESVMKFEDPIDDIQERTDRGVANQAEDYQSIGNSKAQSILDQVQNGTLFYIWSDNTYNHYMTNGTFMTQVKVKSYSSPTCPSDCLNADEVESFFDATYGQGSCSSEFARCVNYECVYQGQRWGGGDCTPLIVDSSASDISSLFEAWYVRIKQNDVAVLSVGDYILELVWGKDTPSANTEYPNNWKMTYLDHGINNVNTQTCTSNDARGVGTWYWDNGFYDNWAVTVGTSNEVRFVSYSLLNIALLDDITIPMNIGSVDNSYDIGSEIKQAIDNSLSNKRLIIEDIGLHNQLSNGASLANASEWLFIDLNYFGFDCDQLMIDVWAWSQQACGSTVGACMNGVLSNWNANDVGIRTLPNFDLLDVTESPNDAITIMTNISKYAEDNVVIQYKFAVSLTNISVPSSKISFKLPSVCNAVSRVSASGTTVDVEFTNCGDIASTFQFTISCTNGNAVSGSHKMVSVLEAVTDWATTTAGVCDTITNVNIASSPCLEFWNIECSWPAAIVIETDSPTPSPTADPTKDPTPSPTDQPTPSPTDQPTDDPTETPTRAPISVFETCTQYHVVVIQSGSSNIIRHQGLCLPSKQGNYILDIVTQTPYYVTEDSNTSEYTTINTINIEDYNTGADSGTPAAATALVGNSVLTDIDRWLDVLSYLGLNLNTYLNIINSETITTTIKIDDLSISSDIPSVTEQTEFKSALQTQLIHALSVNNDQIIVSELYEGSIIAEIELRKSSSSTADTPQVSLLLTPPEMNNALQNLIASTDTSSVSPSVSAPLNSVNHFFYANQTNDIMFNNCPYKINTECKEGSTVQVSWDPLTVIAANNQSIVVQQVIGATVGSVFNGGSYFIRYVALSSTNISIIPQYCSFVIVVTEKPDLLHFLGFEFSRSMFIIIAGSLTTLFVASIAFTILTWYRTGGFRCCRSRRLQPTANINVSHTETDYEGVVVSDEKVNSKKIKLKRQSAPVISHNQLLREN